MNGASRQWRYNLIASVFRGFLVIALISVLFLVFGCSALRPTSKSQQMTTFSLGLPAVVVVSSAQFEAENGGDDSQSGGLTATNDVSPTVELKKDKEDD